MNVTEFLTQCKGDIQRGYVIAALTDRYIVDRWPLAEGNWPDGKKVLEIRVFNESGENKLVRGDVSESFRFRSISDATDGRDSFDEWQYLDIDTSKGRRREDDKTAVMGGEHSEKEGVVTTTGGGSFYFPFEQDVQPGQNARVCIRYYLGKYEETGQARVEDWRVVGFRNE